MTRRENHRPVGSPDSDPAEQPTDDSRARLAGAAEIPRRRATVASRVSRVHRERSASVA